MAKTAAGCVLASCKRPAVSYPPAPRVQQATKSSSMLLDGHYCVQSIFNMLNGSCSSDTSTGLLNQATANLGSSFFRSSFNCTQETPVWSASPDDVDRTLFCGYKQVCTLLCYHGWTECAQTLMKYQSGPVVPVLPFDPVLDLAPA